MHPILLLCFWFLNKTFKEEKNVGIINKERNPYFHIEWGERFRRKSGEVFVWAVSYEWSSHDCNSSNG